MGLLVEGKWHTDWYDTKSTNGKFVRKDASFRNWITADGKPGPGGSGGFKAEKDRYHLYISLACPWAHRTMIFRSIKGLSDFISVSAVNSYMGDEGWTFEPGPGVIADSVNHKTRVHQLYTEAMPDYTGRVTVPVLWDKHQNTIVSNESSEIIRMFNSAFDGVGALAGDYYPLDLRTEIDAVNELVYHNVNNGVYRCGFATTQDAYNEAVAGLFDTLDMLEQRLASQRYLAGAQITEADWRLFTTLIRFDAVYVGHFKCNQKRIADYPVLSNYLRELYQHRGIADTIDIDHIKAHYYASHESINPTRIIPAGPMLDFNQPHNRDLIDATSE
ncbi:glutathione-dependent reductase [Chromatiales bacterium (ex Bugula neritina AB1)]|nr:glutathione-dependent reductase [Chromatiales bacterium (ex Bugula neritina AB1)]